MESELQIRQHLRTSHKTTWALCDHCDYKVRQTCNLRSHIQKHHNDKLKQFNSAKVRWIDLGVERLEDMNAAQDNQEKLEKFKKNFEQIYMSTDQEYVSIKKVIAP